MSKLKCVRAGHRSGVSRILRRIDEKLASGDRHEVDDFDIDIANLKEKQEILKELDAKILESADEKDAETEILDADEYKYSIDSKLHEIRKTLKVKTSTLNPAASSFSSHNDIQENTQSHYPPVTQEQSMPRFSTIRSNSNTVSSEFHKLPKLHLPKFDGNLLEWQSFWDSFDSAVNGNSTLSDVQKFNYLKTLLEGEASVTIAGFALTNTNYQRAVELLQERFGQTHKIRQSYMQELLELPAPKYTLSSLKWYYDTVETYIRGLESLGQTQESYGSLLVSVILNKLPAEICQNLTREHGTTDLTLDELRRSIFKELTILDSGKRATSTTETQQATAAFYTNTKSRKVWTRGNSTAKSLTCAYCKGQHYSGECTKYTDYNARIKIVKRDKLCFNCLGRHAVADCKSKSNCKKCNKRHHTSLCNTETKPNENRETRDTTKEPTGTYTVQSTDIDNETETSVICSSLNIGHRPNVLLKTAVAPVTFRGQTVDTNILFDEGAQRSFITRSLADKLDLQPNGREAITLSGFGDSGENGKIQHLETAKIKLQTIDGKGIMLDVLVVPQIAAPIKTYVQNTRKLPYLQKLKLAHSVTDDDYFEIGLLIGVDQYWNIVEDEVIRGNGPTAVRSKLGYLLSGPCTGARSNINTTMMNIIASHVREEFDIEKFWRVENIGTEHENEKTSFHHEFQKQYEESSIRMFENRYFAKLPWREDHPELPLNRNITYRRTENVVKRLQKEPKILMKYGEIIVEQLKKGFIERVDDAVPTDRKVHYIPHHPVKKESTTTPIRIVYDCSCRENPDSPSLNDCLLNIPPDLNDILSILLRFRCDKYAVTTDIEKAFLNVGLEEEDRDVTRFFWYENPTEPTGPLVTYRFRSVLFGATCSPFILNAVLMKHLKNNPCNWTSTLTQDLYVDNIISSFSSEEQVMNYYETVRPLFTTVGFNLRSWGSNSKKLEGRTRLDNVIDNSEIIKVLGMKWDVKSDTLTYAKPCEIIDSDRQVTKRDVLRQSSKIFDPLGYISPITVKTKMFIQELWKEGIDWDEQLSQELKQKWLELYRNIQKSTTIEFQRMYANMDENESNTKNNVLHVFTDASTKAYGACAYLVTGKHSSIIMAKTRVAPLKTTTIPKLELLGAVTGARLMRFIKTSINISETVLWTDSQIVLAWINSTKPLNTFVKNRIQEIRSLTGHSTWRYCPTGSNPADLLSRGTDFEKFENCKLWFSGPEWILDESKWPQMTLESKILTTVTDDEKISSDNICDNEQPKQKISKIMDISRYDKLSKLLHVTAYVMRFIKNCKTKQRSTGPLSVDEIENASINWILDCQENNFSDIFDDLQRNKKPKHCLSKQLKLYIDENNLIRCKGRIHNAPITEMAKFPILLPTKDEMTNLVIQDAHRKNLHSGTNSTITLLRQVYWIPQIRQIVKTVLRKCTICKKLSGLPYSKPEPPPLPQDRLRVSPPFTVTGVDFTGALNVREAIGQSGKAYICLFTCASTRAIHLELVHNLTEEQFLLAFRRFASRRSVPKVMLSDNAATFSASAREIERLTSSTTLKESLNSQGTKWNFIPKRAPWYGGFWERLIGLTKNCVRKVLGRSLVSFDVLRTVLTEVESILNDRPLTYISTDPLDEDPLTPSHLLNGRKIVSLPYPSEHKTNENQVLDISHSSTNKMYKIKSQLIKHFWRRWKSEYLTSLREYHQIRGKNEQAIRKGAIVQIYDDTPRLQWKLGMVEQVNTGKDGLIRSVTLRTRNGLTSRPISKLYPLELNANDELNTHDTQLKMDRAAKRTAVERIKKWTSGS